nr:uroporphyrinogen-III synthase [Marinicella sp. W31]MDC2875739.1 uroporphyrinogen-III synthase [Marinicella sp. W31]
MRVLVTRPQEKAASTCARLEAMGHAAFQMPLFRPVHFEDAVRNAIGPNRWSALAVTSTEALYGVNAERDAPGMKDRPVFAVGHKTAEAARTAGFNRIVEGGGNGQSLASTIAACPPDEDAPLLYLAGSQRAPFFEEALQQYNIAFETVTVYAMRPVVVSPAQAEKILTAARPDAILFYSAAGAARFFALVRPTLLEEFGLQPEFLCLSAAVAAGLPGNLSAMARIAETPDENSLFGLLD